MDPQIPQARDLLKTEGIVKAAKEDTLAHALTRLTRTHDAIFVFGSGTKFLGVVNPYYTVYKSSFPPETKLGNCVFKPPILSMDTYLWDIAKLMLESKVYYLPVIEKNEFKGIVTINRLLHALQSSQTAHKLQLVKKKKIISIDHDSTLEQAYTTMRDQQVSRLPVVNSQGHLVGVITRYDIQKVLATPVESPRFARVGEKTKFLDRPLESYYHKVVVQAPRTTPSEKLIEEMHTKTVGSVIIVDSNRKPISIVSTHDVLKALDALRPQADTNIELQLSPGFIHETSLLAILTAFKKKIELSYPIRLMRAKIKTDHNPAGKIKRFEVTLEVEFKNKKRTVAAHTEGYDWKKVTRDAVAKVKAQLFD